MDGRVRVRRGRGGYISALEDVGGTVIIRIHSHGSFAVKWARVAVDMRCEIRGVSSISNKCGEICFRGKP